MRGPFDSLVNYWKLEEHFRLWKILWNYRSDNRAKLNLWVVKNKKSRITASHFSSDLHFWLKESEEYYISKMIIGKGPNMSTVFDTLHEPIAKQLHFNQYKKTA